MAAKSKSKGSKSPTKAGIKSPQAKPKKRSKSTTPNKAKKAARSAFSTGLDKELLKKAVHALLQFHEKSSESSKDLLGNDVPVQLQMTLLTTPKSTSPKPIRIDVPHTLHATKPDVCLIVKEDSKPAIQSMIEQFPKEMGCIKKVLGLQSLREKHAQFQQRRELLHKYDVFLADDRILPMLHKPLGNAFLKAKKLPVPVAVGRKNALPLAIDRALNATYMTVSAGTCITIRAGDTTMSEEKIIENIVAIADNAIPKVPRKWANVQVLSIKTPSSVALPVYNKTPEALMEIAKLAGLDKEEPAAETEVEAPEETKERPDTKSKKRKEKSPLLRALKKQEKGETAAEEKPKTRKRSKSKK